LLLIRFRFVNSLGCDKWLYSYGRGFGNGTLAIQRRDHADCNHPYAFGWIAVLYCVSFVVLGAQVLLSLFIGSKWFLFFFKCSSNFHHPTLNHPFEQFLVVATAMEEAKMAQRSGLKTEAHLRAVAVSLGLKLNVQLDHFRAVFAHLDTRIEGRLKRESLKPLARAVLKAIHGGKKAQVAK